MVDGGFEILLGRHGIGFGVHNDDTITQVKFIEHITN